MQYGTNIMPLDDTFQFPATDNDLADARSCNEECQQLHILVLQYPTITYRSK